MSNKTIFGVSVGLIIAIVAIVLAFSDFQSAVEIQQEGEEVMESAKKVTQKNLQIILGIGL